MVSPNGKEMQFPIPWKFKRLLSISKVMTSSNWKLVSSNCWLLPSKSSNFLQVVKNGIARTIAIRKNKLVKPVALDSFPREIKMIENSKKRNFHENLNISLDVCTSEPKNLNISLDVCSSEAILAWKSCYFIRRMHIGSKIIMKISIFHLTYAHSKKNQAPASTFISEGRGPEITKNVVRRLPGLGGPKRPPATSRKWRKGRRYRSSCLRRWSAAPPPRRARRWRCTFSLL